MLLHPPLEYPTTSRHGGSKKRDIFDLLQDYKNERWVTCTTQILWYIYQRDRYHLPSAQQRCHQEFHQLDFHQLCLLEWSLKGMWKYKGMKLGMKFNKNNIYRKFDLAYSTWLTSHVTLIFEHTTPLSSDGAKPSSRVHGQTSFTALSWKWIIWYLILKSMK